MRIEVAVVMGVGAAAMACAPSDSGGGGGDDDAGGDDDGGGGDGGGFEVSGTVLRTSARRLGAAAEGDKIVDFVVAVTPSSQGGGGGRALSPVDAEGHFALDLEPSQPWVLVFVDSTRVGADMIAGVLGAGTLDTLTPTSNGEVDLGMVAVDPEGAAAPGLGYDELLAALGLSPDAAAWLGEVDDLCLRYINPDVDGDGELDLVQDDHPRYLLDFHVQRSLREGDAPVSIATVVGRFLDPATTATFGGTGVYVSFPATFYDGDGADAWLSFSEDLHYQIMSGGGGSGVASAGEQIAGEALILFPYGEMRSVGVYAAAGHDLPQGEVHAGLADRQLAFTGVATDSDAELAAAENLVMPFIRLTPTEEGCTQACAIASLDYEWRRNVAGVWTPMTDEELAIAVPATGAFFSVKVGLDSGPGGFGIELPAATATGSVAWSAANAHLEGGLDEAGFAAATTSDLCHVGLSYDDRLGQRHFGSMWNAPGTCE